MSPTPDRRAGTRYEERLRLTSDDGLSSDVAGDITFDGTDFSMRDSTGAFNPRSGGGGITESEHKALRQLIHFVGTNSPGDGFGSGPYHCETLPAADPFPTSETWYETSSKTNKICRWEGTYNSNKTFATEKWIVYKSDGTNPAADATDTISYSGVFETSRSRAIVVY